MRSTTLFRQYLQAPEILMIPVAHDVLCAKILQGTGFKAVGCTSAASAASMLGGPDPGILTLQEMADAVWRMVDAVHVPVWAGAADRCAGTADVQHTVRLFEQAGAASLMLGDTTAAGLGDSRSEHVVGMDELAGRIKAAVDVRVDRDFTILARTNAIPVHGLANAIERAELCLEAGADWVFLDAAESCGQLRRIPQLLAAPTLVRMAPGDKTPMLPATALQAMGYAAVVWPNAFTLAYAKLAADFAAELLLSGSTAAYHEAMVEADTMDDLLCLPVCAPVGTGGVSREPAFA